MPLGSVLRSPSFLDGLGIDLRSLTSREREAFAAHTRGLSRKNWPRLLLFVTAVTVLWWPTDPILMRDPEMIRIFATIRGAEVIAAAALFALSRTGAFIRRPLLGSTCALLVIAAIVGHGLGRLGPASGPWFGFAYVIPLFTVPMLLPLGARIAVCAVTSMLDRTGDTMRRILASLRPRALEELGLAGAARWLVEDAARWSGLACSIAIDGDEPVDVEAAAAAFRSLQEALQNTARHADATSVSVRLVLCEGALALTVTDDRTGIPEPLPASARGLGLLGMRERASAIGGSASWSRAAGGGTVIQLDLPLRASAERGAP